MSVNNPPQAMRARLSPAKQALLEKHLKGRPATGKQACEISRLAATKAPLSYAQRRLWFLWSLEPGSALYNLGFLLRIRGELDVLALERSLKEIVRRHEVLRTRFVMEDGEPRQVIGAVGGLDIARTDLTDLPETRRAAVLHALAEEVAQQPFDLSTGPLLRVQLMQLDAVDHALVLILHHSISDAWSLGILVREFAALYPALRDDYTAGLAELSVQYADYAVWQRQQIQGEHLEQHLAYWRKRLAGAPPVLDLPSDHPRPANPSGKGAAYCLDLPQPLNEALQRLGRDNEATLFMILAAAFNILLSRHTGQTDLCIGYPVANRPVAELENLIGFFINTLVLRTDLTGNPCFNELLTRVRQAILSDQAHQELPFEKLVEDLQPARLTGRNPLFQVMLVLQNAFTGSLEVPGLHVEAQELQLPVAKFDLALSIAEREGCLHCVFEYSTDLFLEQTIARMAEHWRRLLEGIVANPQVRVSELPMLTEAEHRQLALWNATDAEISFESRLHGLMEAQAARTPDAVAVSHDRQTLSYGILNQRANQLAHALQQRGVGPEVRVGVCLEPGLEMVVALLGILKAGGAYVPVDPGYPPQRQADILTDSGAVLVVAQQRYATVLSPCGAEFFCLDQHPLVGWPEHNPVVACHPDNAAYLIYTSGSTGRPKGVVVSHRNAVHSTAARLVYYGEPVRGFLLLSSYAFDSSVAGIFWTLRQGGQLCIPSEADRRDPVALAQLIAKESISHLLCLPSLYGLLLEQAESRQLETLSAVIVAGEVCPAPIVADHYARLPSVRLYNEYGPTEGTVWSSVHAIQAEEGETGHSVPIGQPISDTQIHLLDAHFNQVPVGVVGELYIGGAGITRGYHERPELTAERFVPDPFAKEAGSRLYKTGDLARYREEGVIEFLGRLDHQVKIRGYRIELGEIEARLLARSEVQEAVVLVREDHPGDKRLAAYLVLRDGAKATEAVIESLRAALKIRLPEYMVPAAYVVLERLPRTPNGKLDRKALPAPDRSHSVANPQVPPRNATEARLVELWREVLRTESIGVHDNFFDLGGYSMLAVQLTFRAREAFGVDMPLRVLFEQPTIEAQARLINGDRPFKASPESLVEWETEAELDPGITPRSVSMPVVVSPAAVLLTGATGFLGAFLLRELLQETNAKIYCLVRGNCSREAAARLSLVLDRYELYSIAANPRIIPLQGDLSQPLLGISPDRFEKLSWEIDTIYHNGAAVDFTASYEVLKPSNVLGTQEALRLACLGKAKAVHYVSTVSVFGEHLPSQPSGFTEEDFPPGNEKLTGGYARSKWVAERMVRKAAERGLSVTVHRPSTIIGDSRSGVWNTGDFLCRMIKGCIELGSAPELDESLDLVPVDYVSKAIVFLSSRPDFLGRTFHLTNRKTISSKVLIDMVREFGYHVRSVPVERWVHDTAMQIKHQPNHVLYPLLPLFEDWRRDTDGPKDAVHQYDCSNTIEALRSGNLDYPQGMEKSIRVVLTCLIKKGFIPISER